MQFLQFTVRDDFDKQKFFSHSAVEPVVNFPPAIYGDGEPGRYTQVLCKIGKAEHVLVYVIGTHARISFLGPILPGDLEEVATCVEYAGGRLFDSHHRVYGTKKKASSKRS